VSDEGHVATNPSAVLNPTFGRGALRQLEVASLERLTTQPEADEVHEASASSQQPLDEPIEKVTTPQGKVDDDSPAEEIIVTSQNAQDFGKKSDDSLIDDPGGSLVNGPEVLYENVGRAEPTKKACNIAVGSASARPVSAMTG